MFEKNSQLFTILFLAGMLVQFCTGKQGIDSITAYQCTEDYAQTASPPVISPTNRMLRVCIAGVSTAVGCHKVVETTITQGSNSIKERLVIAGQQQAADSVEIKRLNKKCMVSVLLADKYFIKSASTASLRVSISGSVEITPSNTTRDSSRGRHLRTEPAQVPFALSVSLAPEKNGQKPAKVVVKAYQCASDYAEVIDPPVIAPGSVMLRVCIAGVANAVECREIVEATIAQESKQILDRLVVSSQQKAQWKDNSEITVKGGKCMITALLTDKYFIRSSSSNSLQVVMSGAVAVASKAASSGGRHLPAERDNCTKASFEIPVSLTSAVAVDIGREEAEPTPDKVGTAATVCIITAGVIVVLVLLIVFREKMGRCFDSDDLISDARGPHGRG